MSAQDSPRQSTHTHAALGTALRDLAHCAARTAVLLGAHRLHQPVANVGRRLAFGDGTSAVVYRETVIDGPPVVDPAALVVEFRLKVLGGASGHAYFREVSVLNTPLFAGFAGFVSKLWLAADEHGTYRGIYQWDGPELAEHYVQALWWPLALVGHVDSIHYQVLPGRWRDDVVDGTTLPSVPTASPDLWWQPTRSAR